MRVYTQSRHLKIGRTVIVPSFITHVSFDACKSVEEEEDEAEENDEKEEDALTVIVSVLLYCVRCTLSCNKISMISASPPASPRFLRSSADDVDVDDEDDEVEDDEVVHRRRSS